MVIEHADFDGVERLSKSLGAEIISTFDCPERADEVLGYCANLKEIMIGEDRLLKFSGCKQNESCSVILRGSSGHLLDEAERSLHDALCVLVKTIQNRHIILGGGNSELRMANKVEEMANEVYGKKALAIKGFAEALRALPHIIAENGGYDSSELVQGISYELRHGKLSMGLDMEKG